MLKAIEWRRYSAADQEAVLRLHREQEQSIGKKMDCPSLDQHPVLVAEVAEKAGTIVGAHYLEATPEYCTISKSPEVTAAAVRRAPVLTGLLKEHGFRVVRVVVPSWMGKESEIILAALSSLGAVVEDEYRHAVIDLRS